MKKMLKNIFAVVLIFWCCGGGFIISLLCLIWSWKIALAIFCFWCCSLIIGIMVAVLKKP